MAYNNKRRINIISLIKKFEHVIIRHSFKVHWIIIPGIFIWHDDLLSFKQVSSGYINGLYQNGNEFIAILVGYMFNNILGWKNYLYLIIILLTIMMLDNDIHVKYCRYLIRSWEILKVIWK